jgi:hypothetical protein
MTGETSRPLARHARLREIARMKWRSLKVLPIGLLLQAAAFNARATVYELSGPEAVLFGREERCTRLRAALVWALKK